MKKPGAVKAAAIALAATLLFCAATGGDGGAQGETAEDFLDQGVRATGRGDLENAIADYTEALRLNPDYALAYNNRGDAYYNQGRYDQAIEDYTAALRIDPNFTLARNNLETAQKARGKGTDA
jgi:tetratricopeptide (TPR) repeat protein